jgi:hypothetical protein
MTTHNDPVLPVAIQCQPKKRLLTTSLWNRHLNTQSGSTTDSRVKKRRKCDKEQQRREHQLIVQLTSIYRISLLMSWLKRARDLCATWPSKASSLNLRSSYRIQCSTRTLFRDYKRNGHDYDQRCSDGVSQQCTRSLPLA